MSNVVWVDWVILGVIALSTVVSLIRGFVKEALSLLSWVAAFIVARLFYTKLAVLLENAISTPSVRYIAAFVILFVATLILGAMLNHLISAIVKLSGISGTDRVLGMVFGAVRGVVLVVVAIALLRLTPVTEDPWWNDSLLIPHFAKIEAWSRNLLGDSVSTIM
ncbi:MAG: CvpA family protein [Gammaproteobacteria bacterium]|nr:MAG: CvpA family protein [Gammaproteobacteria bacterium]